MPRTGAISPNPPEALIFFWTHGRKGTAKRLRGDMAASKADLQVERDILFYQTGCKGMQRRRNN